MDGGEAAVEGDGDVADAFVEFGAKIGGELVDKLEAVGDSGTVWVMSWRRMVKSHLLPPVE